MPEPRRPRHPEIRNPKLEIRMSNVAEPGFLKLLPADAVGRIGALEFTSRQVMSGFLSGRHRSPHRGTSVEFLQHRPYAPGDDPRDLDWRVYAKNDRYYIRQHIEETNLRCTVLLDASGSMGYRGTAAAPRHGRPLSKFEYARHLGALLTYLLIQQQDAVGLVLFDTKVRRFVPPAARPTQVRVVLEEMERAAPGAESSLATVFHDIAERVPRRGLVVVISDLFDHAAEIVKALHHFRYRGHEVIVWHVMAEEELSFPFRDFSRFRDLEHAGRELALDPHAVRAQYLRRLEQFLADIRRGCGELQADYVPFPTTRPFEAALSDYLAAREMR
jgi:uncharacterized protein (DUF58 family)